MKPAESKHRRLSALLLAILLAVPVWFVYRAYHQQQLDRALIAALKRDDTQAALSLLARGADANARDWPPQKLSFWQRLWPGSWRSSPNDAPAPTALQVAIAAASSDAIRPKPDSPLPMKAPANRREAVQALLNRGADAKVLDAYGFSTFGIAIGNNYADIALLCLEKGARANYFERALALQRAISARDADLVKALLEKGAEPNLQTLNSGRVKLDGWQWDYSDLPALIYAVIDNETGQKDPDEQKRAAVLDALRDSGADINSKDSEGRTALIWAAFQSNEKTVSLLLQRGAEVTQTAKNGDTALSIARRRNNANILRMLQQAGAKRK